jgi:hypothetical protein
MSQTVDPAAAAALALAARYHAGWLRERGWTCTPPYDGAAPVPEPATGQVWHSPAIRTEPRAVIDVTDGTVSYSTPRYALVVMSRAGWRAWVRSSHARPEMPA